MRKAMVFAGLVLGFFMLTGLAQAAEKFAYIDLSRTFSEYNKTKDFDKVLTDKETAYTADMDKKVAEVKQLQDKLNLLSDKEKESRKGDLQSKVKTLQDYDREKQTDLRKEQDERMREILKDIEEAVKKYAEQQGYTFVFNDRVLVYQAKAYDITDKIVEIINKGYTKK